MIKRITSLVTALVLTGAVFADEIALRPDHPTRYVVVKGDTLWDISARFLETPWRWPEVWSFNPQIKNPHLIYPGDVVSLVYDEHGKPMLKVERGQPTVKIAPQVRAERIDTPISTIPLNEIAHFLGQPLVVTESEIANAAYIVASNDGHIISGKGDTIYVRGLVTGGDSEYVIIRVGKAYKNPGSSSVLGYEAIQVADAKVEAFGDPSTLKIRKSLREVLVGDRLLPKRDKGFDQTFIPRPPEARVEGQIIAVVDGVSRVGQYQTVVVNKGEKDGIQTGHVLSVWQAGEQVRDPRAGEGGELITLPDVKAGILMIIRSYDMVSHAMVMQSERDMRVLDLVRNPQ